MLLLGAAHLVPLPKHMLLLCRLWRSERWLPFLALMLGGTLRLPWTTVAVKMSLSRWGAPSGNFAVSQANVLSLSSKQLLAVYVTLL